MTATKFTPSQINNALNKVLKKHGLKTQHTMSTSGEFLVKTLTGKGKTFLIKIRQIKSPIFRQRFFNEIAVNHFIKNLKLKNLTTPAFLESNRKNQPEYLLYEFIKGIPLNTYYFYVGARQADNLINSKFLEIIYILQKKYKEKKLRLKLPKHNFNNNFAIYKQYEPVLKKYLKPAELSKTRQLLIANRRYFDQVPMVFTHGDINPKNIIIKNNQVAIIDWSDVQLNNPLFDFCSLYLYAWNLPKVMKNIKEFILNQYDHLPNADRLYLLNRLILTPKIIKITEDSIKGLGEDRRNKIILPETEIKLKNKAKQAIETHLRDWQRIVRHLENWQKPSPVIKSIDRFLNTAYVNKFLQREKKKLKIIAAWQRLRIINKRLALRSDDQKMISQYELIDKRGRSYYLMAKIRVERGDDLGRQSYYILKAIWQNKKNRPIISRPLGYYPQHFLFLYEKVVGSSLASRLEQKTIDTKKVLPKFIKQAGVILANLHQIPTTNLSKIKLVSNYGINEQMKWLEFYFEKISALHTIKNLRVVNDLKEVIKKNKKTKVAKTFIHGDYQLQNLIIKNDYSRIKLIDFDNAEIKDPLIDVGNFLYQIKYKNILQNGINQLRQMFLDSYLKNSPQLDKTNFNERINLYVIMAVVKNINFNCLNRDYDLAAYDMKIIRHLLDRLNKNPLSNLRACARIKP